MPRSELVLVRVSELEPGRRVFLRHNNRKILQTVAAVHADDGGSLILITNVGAYVCDPNELVDAELETSEVCA